MVSRKRSHDKYSGINYSSDCDYRIVDDDMINEFSKTCLRNGEMVSEMVKNFQLKKKENDPKQDRNDSMRKAIGVSVAKVSNGEVMCMSKPDIIDNLRTSFENRLGTDLCVQIGNDSFDCHMLVVKMYSEYFVNCGTSTVIKLPDDAVDITGFRLFYEWCLSSEFELNYENVLHLLRVATFLRVPELFDHCWAYIKNMKFIKEDVAYDLFQKANGFNLPLAACTALQRLGRYFLIFVSSKSFLDLTPQQVGNLLSSDDAGVHVELEMLYTLVLWVNHNWSERKKSISHLCKHIRFFLISPALQFAFTQPTNEHELNRVLLEKNLQMKLHKTLKYSLKHENHAYNSECNCPAALTNLAERNWIHKNETDERFKNIWHDLTYGKFLKYMKYLQTQDVDYWKRFVFVHSQ